MKVGMVQQLNDGVWNHEPSGYRGPVVLPDRHELARTDSFTMAWHGTYVSLLWHEGVRITLDHARRSGEVLADLMGGKRIGLAVYVRRLVRIDPEAREAIMAADMAPRVALIGGDPVDAVITAFARQSIASTRYFQHEGEALAWLHQLETE